MVSSPRIGKDLRAGTLAEKGCGCHERGGLTGWETQDGGSGCNWAMAKRTPGNFQPKNWGRSTQEHQKALAGRRADSRSPLLEVTWKHIEQLSLVFA